MIKIRQVKRAMEVGRGIWLGQIAHLFLLVSLVSCQRAGVPNPAETSCASLQGEWRLRQVSCAGIVQASTPAVTLEFLENQRVNQVNGASACQTVYPWQYVLGSTQPTFDFLSESNLQCRSSGETATDCSVSGTTCDSATDFSGIANTFSSCFIRGGEVYLRRTVTALNNPDSLSYCEDGQSEQLIFTSLESSSGGSGQSGSVAIGFRAFLRLASSQSLNFPSTDLGSSRALRITLENIGPEYASRISVTRLEPPFSFVGGSYPGTGGNCGETLNPESSCQFLVEFRPRALGSFAQEVQFSYFDGREQKALKIPVRGESLKTAGVIQISNGPVFDFGEALVGQSKSHRFTLRNTGELPVTEMGDLNLTGPFALAGGFYPGTGGTCGDRLNPNESCLLTLEFSPPNGGSFNGRFEVLYNTGVEIRSSGRNLFGRGL